MNKYLWGHGGYAFYPKGRGFESCSSRHIGTLGNSSLTVSSLKRFGVKLQHSIRAALGAHLSSSGLEEVL